MRASAERARAWKLFPFSHSKTAISFNILLVLLIVPLSQKHIYFSGLKLHPPLIYIQSMQFPCYYLWYGVVYKRQLCIPTKH